MKNRSRLVIAALVFSAAVAFGEEPTRTKCPAFIDPDARTPAEWSAMDLPCRVEQLILYARTSPDKKTRAERYAAVLPHAALLRAVRADDESYRYLVWAQFHSGDAHGAIRTGQEWILISPQSFKAHFVMSQVLANEWTQLESALHHGEQALELAVYQKDRYDIQMQIGYILELLRRYEQAIALYEELGAKNHAERVKVNAESVVRRVCKLRSDEVSEELKAEREALEKQMRLLQSQPEAAKGGG